MSVNTRVESGVAIIELRGRITIAGGDVTLRDAFLKALDDGHIKLLIDVEGVSYVDSAGLGELVRCKATAASRGATVKLVHVEERLHKVMLLTRLIGVFEIFDDEKKAIASFA
jgi:anti-sigma B factor antagonist